MDTLIKKTKRASVQFDDEPKSRLKYQTLLEEHLELQKEFVSRKRKLEAAKEKKKTILAEVRFLRQRRKYLSRARVLESHVEAAEPQNLDQVTKTEEAAGTVRVHEDRVHEDNLKLNKTLKSRLNANRRLDKHQPNQGCLKV